MLPCTLKIESLQDDSYIHTYIYMCVCDFMTMLCYCDVKYHGKYIVCPV